jgi:hypothetical protein
VACCGHTVSNPEVFEVASILSFSIVCGLAPVVVVTSTVNGNDAPSAASLDNLTIISNIKELLSKKSLDDTDVVPKIINNTHKIKMQKISKIINNTHKIKMQKIPKIINNTHKIKMQKIPKIINNTHKIRMQKIPTFI